MGCQQKIYNINHNDNEKFLENISIMCPNKKFIKYIKYFSTGTLYLVISIIIYNF